MKSAQDQAYESIRDRIINLELKPGSKLRAEELAKQLDMSRTPVREALGRLEQQGLVTRDGWGYTVRAITFKEILDLFKIRESLETQAAVEACAHLDDKALGRLKLVLAKAEQFLKKQKMADFRAANREFHMMISAASQNDLLGSILLMLNDRIRLVSALHQDIMKNRARDVLSENFEILNALTERNAEKVEAAVLGHLRNSKEEFLHVVIGTRSIQSPVLSANPDTNPGRRT